MRIVAAVLMIGLALQGTASAEIVELQNGDKLEDVVVLEENERVWIVEHPVLGRLEIPASEIKPPEAEKPAEVKPGVFGTSFLEGWTKAFSAGFSGSSGVTKENNVNVDLELNNETESHRDRFIARYFFTDADGLTTKNEFLTRHIHDFLIKDSKWFTYLGGGYKYDELQSWDHRYTGSAGVGYDFLNDDRFKLTGRIGPGFTVTRDGDDREDFNGVAMLQFSWAIMEGLGFNGETAYFPVLNDLPEFRSFAKGEFKVAIGVVEGLSFKFGGSYEYDSQNVERNDRKYYANIVYDF